MTEKYKRKRDFCRYMSFLCIVLPILVFAIIAFINGEVGDKVTLGLCLLTCLLFTLINLIFKHHIRCTIWIMILGIYVCIGNIIPLLFVMIATTGLDEFVFTPLYKRYNNKYIINKEIDKRQ